MKKILYLILLTNITVYVPTIVSFIDKQEVQESTLVSDKEQVLTTFDVEKMSVEPIMIFDLQTLCSYALELVYNRIEGYWATDKDPTQDRYKGKYPWPTVHEKPWSGKQAFLERLHQIEKLKDIKNSCIGWQLYRGVSWSRVDFTWIGCGEYKDYRERITWPEAYSSHYIDKYNVKPSREFYDYVMSFPL